MHLSPLIHWGLSNQQARVRLFCFPYAGGSEFVYRTWARSMPPAVEVCPVPLPGRWRRFGEQAFTRMGPLVEHLVAVLGPYLDKPFAFYGHSMGALISFELARALRRMGMAQPVHLFVAAHRSPERARLETRLHDLPDEEFLELLHRYGAIPVQALQNAELTELVLPMLRADFAVCETYRYIPEPPLDCRITALGGIDDLLRREELEAWKQHTTAGFSLHMFPGDHFFLRDQEVPLVQLIARELLEDRGE